jgi:hypothetical protein
MKKFLCLGLLVVASSVSAKGVVVGELVTDNYHVTITDHCGEGSVTCNHVTYLGVNRKSGNPIQLTGATMHTMCADGKTPCRFLGYQFKNGDVTYYVMEEGVLRVVKGSKHKEKVLLEEQGEWKNR